MFKISILFFLLNGFFAEAQINNTLAKGNKYYNIPDYEKAAAQYTAILEKEKTNFKAAYNMAATLFKQKKYEAAIAMYANAIVNAPDNVEKTNALYNQANALVQIKKYAEAIENYKKTLKENPNDSDCRFNLTKAMQALEKQKKQQQDQSKKQDKNKQEAPKQPNRNQLQQMDQTLQMLRRKEKNVQDRLRDNNKFSGKKAPDKDW